MFGPKDTMLLAFKSVIEYIGITVIRVGLVGLSLLEKWKIGEKR